MIRESGRGESGCMMEINEEGIPALTIDDIMARYGWDAVDVIKMDIEGSEKSVFEGDYTNWLPKTRVLFTGLHEHKSPGCTKVLNDVLKNYNFERDKSDEYEVFINRDLI